MANKNILVLGSGGMVGHTVFNYLCSKFPNSTFGTVRKDPSRNQFKFIFKPSSDNLERTLSNIKALGFVVNCTGELKNGNPHRMSVNFLLPSKLDELSEKYRFKLIHISTDDVFPTLSGTVIETNKPKPENLYAKTKLKGETKSPNSLTIRTSLIGFDNNKKGLLEWIINSKKNEIPGFDDQIWSGCTSLQFAKLCEYLVSKNNFNRIRKKSNVIHFTPLGPVSKYDLIYSINKILMLKKKVVKSNSEYPVSRKLNSIYLTNRFLSKYNRNIDLSILEMYKFENK